MKADDKVMFDGAEKKEKFTYFEEVAAQVDELRDVVDKHAEILRQNNLFLKKIESAPFVEEDNIYNRLE